jgi:hypothetical protein
MNHKKLCDLGHWFRIRLYKVMLDTVTKAKTETLRKKSKCECQIRATTPKIGDKEEITIEDGLLGS